VYPGKNREIGRLSVRPAAGGTRSSGAGVPPPQEGEPRQQQKRHRDQPAAIA